MRKREYRVQEKPTSWVVQEKVTDTEWHPIKACYCFEDAIEYKANLEALQEALIDGNLDSSND